MHGEIKLGRWLPFTAEQVIRTNRGMVWRASVRWNQLPILGADSLLDGKGAMRWRLLGILPVMTASGPDIARSAAGRLGAEFIWLPSALCADDVRWVDGISNQTQARLVVQGHAVTLALALAEDGRLQRVELIALGQSRGRRVSRGQVRRLDRRRSDFCRIYDSHAGAGGMVR
jgi:hypothetical protein